MSEQPTLELLYEHYMDTLAEQNEADAQLRAAEAELQSTIEWQAVNTLSETAVAKRIASAHALTTVKAATADAFRETGDRQPHPYAGVLRLDRRPVYNKSRALDWCRERPDYRQYIIPASLDTKGFEKLARALDGADVLMFYGDGGIDVPLVEWEAVPVVSVKIREV